MSGRLFIFSKIKRMFFDELHVFLNLDEDPPLKKIFSTIFPRFLTVRTTGLKSSSPETSLNYIHSSGKMLNIKSPFDRL
jgi:hypothetical protein